MKQYEALWSAIGSLLYRFAPDESERYVRHCGYANQADFALEFF
jgi:hypothetical protein